MAFYDLSHILRPAYYHTNEYHNKTLDLHFYHNKACRNGGAIFVEDSDYIQMKKGPQLSKFV